MHAPLQVERVCLIFNLKEAASGESDWIKQQTIKETLIWLLNQSQRRRAERSGVGRRKSKTGFGVGVGGNIFAISMSVGEHEH